MPNQKKVTPKKVAPKKDGRGGARPGSGRKPQGKKSYLLSLTESNAELAKKTTDNFSALMDGLLAAYLSHRKTEAQD